jgi:hypothetical protein
LLGTKGYVVVVVGDTDMQRIHLKKKKDMQRIGSHDQGRPIYRPQEWMTARFMSSSALQNVVKGLTTMVEQHCDVKKPA